MRRRHLPLRGRLALITAAAVAATLTVFAGTAWFIMRGQLVHQLDQSLAVTTQAPASENPCRQSPPADPRQRGFLPITQVVSADGATCVPPGDGQRIVVENADLAVARGHAHETFRYGRTANGVEVRVYTQPIEGHRALMMAKPLSGVDDALSGLVVILAVIAGIGVIVAAGVGLIVARAGLAPLHRLTGAVEHVARTEDLTTRIPVDGTDEVARLGASVNTMTAALASSREHQQRLIADAGHELRTPLTSLRANVDLLLRSEATGRAIPGEQRHRLLTGLRAQMRELTDLIGDLLELARPAPEAPTPDAEPAALHELVHSAVERARLRAPGLTFAADLRPWYVRGHPRALERAVMNLLDNAAKFSPPGGTIAVRLHDGELTVRDQGPGVAPEELPHVFDRFWRSPAARGMPGSGLGLSIVARAAAEAGGTVSLEPAPGGGTLARLRLPGIAP